MNLILNQTLNTIFRAARSDINLLCSYCFQRNTLDVHRQNVSYDVAKKMTKKRKKKEWEKGKMCEEKQNGRKRVKNRQK